MRTVGYLLGILRNQLNESSAGFYTDDVLINELYAAESSIYLSLVGIYTETGVMPKDIARLIKVGDFIFNDTLSTLSGYSDGSIKSTENVYKPISVKITEMNGDPYNVEIPIRNFDECDFTNGYELCLMESNEGAYRILGATVGYVRMAYFPYFRHPISGYSTTDYTILPEMYGNAVIQKAYASILAKDKDPRYESEMAKADAIIKGLI